MIRDIITIKTYPYEIKVVTFISPFYDACRM
jgi:hypothetical protein